MTRRVAIVGAGIAGLTACRAMAKRCDVDLFDAAPNAGGHAQTVTFGDVAVDIGFVVYNRVTYPCFTRILDDLRVETRPTNMSFSVADRTTGLEYGSADLGAVFAQRRNLVRPSHYKRMFGVLRFLRTARRDLASGATDSLTLGDYLEQSRTPAVVATDLVEPLASALWSMPPDRVTSLPASTFLRFLYQHGMLRPVRPLTWRTIVGGSKSYVAALLESIPGRVHLGQRVTRIRRHPTGAILELANGETHECDDVVIALHADQALALLDTPTEREQAILGSFRFTDNELCLHTDTSVMPRRRAAWASWNYQRDNATDRVSVTYWMNRLQGISGDTQYLVTLNPGSAIAPDRVLHTTRMRHPLFDFNAVRAQSLVTDIQGTLGTYYCGAWCGFGFHEDGARSGLIAAARLLSAASRSRACEVAA